MDWLAVWGWAELNSFAKDWADETTVRGSNAKSLKIVWFLKNQIFHNKVQNSRDARTSLLSNQVCSQLIESEPDGGRAPRGERNQTCWTRGQVALYHLLDCMYFAYIPILNTYLMSELIFHAGNVNNEEKQYG